MPENTINAGDKMSAWSHRAMHVIGQRAFLPKYGGHSMCTIVIFAKYIIKRAFRAL